MKDRDRHIWLGTYNQGAIVINPRLSSVTNLDLQFIKSETAYLPNITRVFEDSDGELWMRQNRVGLFLLNREHMAIRRSDIPEINAANAICNNTELNEIWVAVDFFPATIHRVQKRNGKVTLLGSIDGLCIFTPSPQLTASGKDIKTLITDLKINNRSVFQNESEQKIRNLGIEPSRQNSNSQSEPSRQNPNRQNELVLRPHETNLEIDFSSFNYLNPGKTRYACKLEGIDKQWIITEPHRNFAIYNQLRKGKYTFLVKSSGDNQLWSDEVT